MRPRSPAGLLLVCLSSYLQPALASTVIVPDESPTVQLAIDSWADTVLIRPGSYPESPVVDHPLVLRGFDAQRPRLGGLHVSNANFWATSRLLSVNAVDFMGSVTQTTVDGEIRNLELSFSDCALDSGFVQLLSTDPEDVASLTFLRCQIHGANARSFRINLEADTVDAGVSWQAHDVLIDNCWFRGGTGVGIVLSGLNPTGRVTNNVIENYVTGIYVEYGDPCVIASNTIRQCDIGVHMYSGYESYVTDNAISNCGAGIIVRSIEVVSQTSG